MPAIAVLGASCSIRISHCDLYLYVGHAFIDIEMVRARCPSVVTYRANSKSDPPVAFLWAFASSQCGLNRAGEEKREDGPCLLMAEALGR